MKHLQLLFVFALAFVLGSCGATHKDIQIETARDGRINLDNYKTYGWFANAAVIADEGNRFVKPGYDIGAELRFLIGREMRQLGYSEVVDDPPDLLVAFVVLLDMDSIKIIEDRKRNITTIEEVPEGAIYVELIDPKTELAVWAGVAVADVQEGFSDEQSKARLDYAIKPMFKNAKK